MLLASCFLLLASCATINQPVPKKHFTHKAKVEHKRAPETGARKEVIRTEPKPLAVGATPQARAAAKLVENGRRELTAGSFESAERSFQEAINIDPSNGIAYYYLAKSKYELGRYGQARGVLDKAESLLTGSKEWLDAVDALREMIKSKL